MTILDKILKDGKLPEIETKVAITAKSLSDIALALIVVALVIMLGWKLLKMI